MAKSKKMKNSSLAFKTLEKRGRKPAGWFGPTILDKKTGERKRVDSYFSEIGIAKKMISSENRKTKPVKAKYSSLEKKAYYAGFGIGVEQYPPVSGPRGRRAQSLMSSKERESFQNGYNAGYRSGNIDAGIRNKKQWFK